MNATPPGSAAALGPLLSDHRLRPSLRRIASVLAILGLGGGIVALSLGLVRWYFAYAHFGPSAVWRWSLPFVALAAALLLTGLYGLSTLWGIGRLTIRAHRGGLTVNRGRRRWTIPWTQVSRIHTSSVRYRLPGLARRSRAELTLFVDAPAASPSARGPGPSTIRLTHALADLDKLTECVKQQVYPALLAQYVHAFNQGKPLSFGSLILTRDGLQNGRHTLRWQDLGRITLRQGVLVLDPAAPGRGPRIRLPAHRLPNVELCLELIQSLSAKP